MSSSVWLPMLIKANIFRARTREKHEFFGSFDRQSKGQEARNA